MKSSVYAKSLKQLGLKQSTITTVTHKMLVFKGLRAGKGYAAQYTYEQACFIVLGCHLLMLGISSRYTNQALCQLSTYRPKIFADRGAIRERQYVMSIGTLHYTKGHPSPDICRDLVTGEIKSFTLAKRTEQVLVSIKEFSPVAGASIEMHFSPSPKLIARVEVDLSRMCDVVDSIF